MEQTQTNKCSFNQYILEVLLLFNIDVSKFGKEKKMGAVAK